MASYLDNVPFSGIIRIRDMMYTVADPYRLGLSRSPNPHLGFGYGTHICLGRNIALLEVRQILQTVLRRVDAIELAGPVEWTSSVMATGVRSLPISFRAA